MFTDKVLKAEQEEYKAEGVAWQTITYRDNAAVLALLEHKPMGALALLDEEWFVIFDLSLMILKIIK